MKRLRFLLLDAGIVFKLLELNLWQKVLEKHEILLSKVVAEEEVRFFKGIDENEVIDLAPDIKAGRITIVEVTASRLVSFRNRFTEEYLEKLDPGESESLCYLVDSCDDCHISSSDAIVYRVLGCLNLGDRGMSLEELLQKSGLSQGKSLDWKHSQRFREKYTKDGQREFVTGVGLKVAG